MKSKFASNSAFKFLLPIADINRQNEIWMKKMMGREWEIWICITHDTERKRWIKKLRRCFTDVWFPQIYIIFIFIWIQIGYFSAGWNVAVLGFSGLLRLVEQDWEETRWIWLEILWDEFSVFRFKACERILWLVYFLPFHPVNVQLRAFVLTSSETLHQKTEKKSIWFCLRFCVVFFVGNSLFDLCMKCQMVEIFLSVSSVTQALVCSGFGSIFADKKIPLEFIIFLRALKFEKKLRKFETKTKLILTITQTLIVLWCWVNDQPKQSLDWQFNDDLLRDSFSWRGVYLLCKYEL